MDDPHGTLETADRIIEALAKMELAHVSIKGELNYQELRKSIAMVVKENDNLRARIDLASDAFSKLRKEVQKLKEKDDG